MREVRMRVKVSMTFFFFGGRQPEGEKERLSAVSGVAVDALLQDSPEHG